MSLAADERGASIIELGLVAPILAALLMGMVDLSNAYSHRLKLEQAAQRTIEKVMQQHDMLTSYTASLKAEGALAAGVNQSAVVPDAWLECSTNGTTWVRKTGFPGTCDSTEPYYARYVTVAITKPFTPMFSTQYFMNVSGGAVTLTGTAGVRIQ